MSTLKFEGIVTAKTAVFVKELNNGIKMETLKICVEEANDEKHPISLEIIAMNYDVDNLKFDKIKTLENVKKGDFVEVEYKPNCKIYEGSKGTDMFGSNNLWSIKVLNSKENAANVPQDAPTDVPANVTPTDGDDTLPF